MHRAQSGPIRVRIEARQRGSINSILAVPEERKDTMFFLIWNEAEQRTIPLRSRLECRVATIPVKGQDERPADALDSARRHFKNCRVQTRTAATSALTFMTFS
jgi:hypothetical protein